MYPTTMTSYPYVSSYSSLSQGTVPQQSPSPYFQPQYPRPSTSNIIWAQGDAGAKAHQLPPSSSAIILDSESKRFFIKTTDAAGIPSLKTYDFKESAEPCNQVNVVTPTQEDISNLKTEIESMKKTIEELRQEIKSGGTIFTETQACTPTQAFTSTQAFTQDPIQPQAQSQPQPQIQPRKEQIVYAQASRTQQPQQPQTYQQSNSPIVNQPVTAAVYQQQQQFAG